MKQYFLLAAVFAAALTAGAVDARAAIKVVTTTQDLEAIAREVGGDKITVESLAKGYQDPHFVEIPTGQITRAMGDVHPSGNPHYWLGPDNGRRIAQEIQKKLSQLSPGDAGDFAQRDADFDRRLGGGGRR